MKHKGYNGNIVSEHPYKYNGVELNESLDLNLYEMDLRQYDPAIARFTSIDPITHFSMSPYMAFDGNPIFWADPSGADAECGNCDRNGVSLISEGRYRGVQERKEIANGKDENNFSKLITDNSFVQSYPNEIDFVNTKSKEEKDKFLDDVIAWFGYVDQFGNRNIHPGSIINFYAQPKEENEKNFGQKILDFIDPHNEVLLTDGKGNTVRIGYQSNVKKHAGIFSGSYVQFDDLKDVIQDGNVKRYNIYLRSHQKGSGNPAAIIYMNFKGKNKDYFDEIYNKIKAYKPYKAKRIPHIKQ